MARPHHHNQVPVPLDGQRSLVSPLSLSFSFGQADLALSFFDGVSRIGGLNYIPTETDVLRARAKSTGITETRFNMGQLS